MKISFVLPVYNEQAYISMSIDSIVRMKDYKPMMDIVIIDDASTDMTPNILEALKKKHKNIKLITNKERKGAAYCRNLGNKEAKGDIIVVCDADVNEEYRLRWIIKTFKEQDIDIFYSGYYTVTSKDISTRNYVPIYGWDFKSKCSLSHPTIAYKKEAVLECPYHEVSPETDLFEFMLLDMNKANKKFGGVHIPLITKIEGNRVRDRSESDKLKKEMYNKYGIKI